MKKLLISVLLLVSLTIQAQVKQPSHLFAKYNHLTYSIRNTSDLHSYEDGFDVYVVKDLKLYYFIDSLVKVSQLFSSPIFEVIRELRANGFKIQGDSDGTILLINKKYFVYVRRKLAYVEIVYEKTPTQVCSL